MCHYSVFLKHFYIRYSASLLNSVYSIIPCFWDTCIFHYSIFLLNPVYSITPCIWDNLYSIIPCVSGWQDIIYLNKQIINGIYLFLLSQVYTINNVINLLRKEEKERNLSKISENLYTPFMQVLQHFKEIVKIQHDSIQ